MKAKKEKMPLKKRIVLAFTVLVLALIVGILFAAILSTPTDSPDNNTENTNVANELQKVLFEDENYKVTYLDFEDKNLGITMLYLNLKVENNSDSGITVTFEDAYMNDTSIQFISGFPLEILPGKNAVAANGFGYDGKGIDGIEDVKKLEFKLVFRNSSDFSEILKTDNIVLEY